MKEKHVERRPLEPSERSDVRVGHGPLRCPFCHEDVSPERSVVCQDCLARHHDECWTESASCSSCGSLRRLEPAGRDPLDRESIGAPVERSLMDRVSADEAAPRSKLSRSGPVALAILCSLPVLLLVTLLGVVVGDTLLNGDAEWVAFGLGFCLAIAAALFVGMRTYRGARRWLTPASRPSGKQGAKD